MKTIKNLIGIGTLLLIFGGMGLDGTESTVAYILVVIGLALMGIGAKKLKALLIVTVCTVFMMFPAMEVNAQSSEQILSDEIIGYCEDVGQEYGICSELLQAIIEKESMGKADAENNGCIGLMQINEKYHKDRMKHLMVTDLYDPYSNILVGADYIMELADKYGDVALVLMVFHGEKDALEKNEQGIISNYAKKILERSEFLEREHGK